MEIKGLVYREGCIIEKNCHIYNGDEVMVIKGLVYRGGGIT